MNVKRYFILLLILLCSGCISNDIDIYSTKQYEGHFYSKDEVENAIKDMKLQKNESVWLLSNTTLKRVLKNGK